MVIRYFILPIFLFFLSTQANLNPSLYRPQARAWINTHVVSKNNTLIMSNHDLQICANLFYFSYLRSLATLEAQESISNALKYFWHGWQNIARTRMNPSVHLPFDTDYELQKDIYTEFIKAQEHHRKIGQFYAHIAELAVKGNALTPSSKEAILEVRTQARQVMIQAFSDVKKILGNLIDFASAHLRSGWIPWDDENESTRFNLIDTISDYVPSLALKSYLEMEKINTQATEQTWQILMTMQSVNQQIWHAVEIARASYYLAYYQELYTCMHNNNLHDEYFAQMIHETGTLTKDQMGVLLPLVR